ncbi:hypothetical protein NHX12_015540 [Muraenolepis orangiensis]|uniref:Uncharacterized protein n=1 Tax=Muraenolepis orangiensis TaxID=630683 RepID=A0A9Q0D8X3_9TELE|nr:hypothetical protein NHX12_015540 [Muraenolepis orangiensis]
MDSSYKDFPLHSAVRWLSCGKALERFVGCFDAIKAFLAEKGQDYPELEDEKWVVKLQGAGQTVLDMFDTWKAFVGKLAVFSDDVASTFRYFSH